MADNNTGVFVALLGVGVAATIMLSGRGGGGSSSGLYRQSVVDGFQPGQIESLREQLEAVASGSSSSPTAPTAPDNSVNDPGDSSTWQQGFAQQVVERTGYLPDGFDAAGRVSQIDRGNTVGL